MLSGISQEIENDSDPVQRTYYDINIHLLIFLGVFGNDILILVKDVI